MRNKADAYAAEEKEAQRLVKKGHIAEAFDLLGKIVLQSGQAAYIHIAEPWLNDSRILREAGELAISTLIARLTFAIDRCEAEERQRYWQLCLKVLREIPDQACQPRNNTTDRYIAECILLRHMEEGQAALEAAQKGMKLHGTATCYTFAGLCFMDLDQVEQAEEHIRLGYEADPENAAGCNDLADYFFNQRRYDKAREYYSMVLKSGDPYDCGWAEPSWLFCRYLLEKDPVDLERLIACAAVDSDNERAAELCCRMHYILQIPYVDYLPGSSEAGINFLREMRRRESDIAEGKMSLSCQEAASCINAIRLELSHYGQRKSSFEIVVSHVPDPPLDSLITPEGIRLWNYSGDNDAVPAVKRPYQGIADCVRQLAIRKFSLPQWYEKAAELAPEMDSNDRADLYSCMVYPPAPEQSIPAEDWLMRIQFAAVCILAQMGDKYLQSETETMEYYVNTLPSPELAAICLGQLDWPVIPALTLLAWQSGEGIADQKAVLSIMDELLRRVPKQDYAFFEHALVCALTWVPGYGEEFYDSMRLYRQRLEEE